ncbi:MAG: YhcH/YjgK/YiaL family protein [Spirochaetes bacterium]|nr:YhcH/YjgK/YiaL family protein [Spirochaetota bacterium]
MILSTLSEINASHRLNERIAAGLAYIAKLPPDIADGEYPIDGKNVFARIMTVTTEPRDKRFYETHREYIDVQYVMKGSQIIEWLPRSAMNDAPYDAEKDVIKYTAHPKGTGLKLGGGVVAIFFPDDAHRPLCMDDAVQTIRVCVVKVRV